MNQGERPPASELGYDPNKTCGDYGGRSWQDKPCRQPAGWNSSDASGRCVAHDRIAEEYRRAKKEEILALLPHVPNIKEIVAQTGVHGRTIYEWRQHDEIFRLEFDAIQRARDTIRAAEVEDKVYERIMADKASPAETIFFLKNRDPERWKDLFASKPERDDQRKRALQPVDSAKAKLSATLKDMARRRAEASRADARRQSEAEAMETRLAAEVRGEATGEPDDDATGSEG